MLYVLFGMWMISVAALFHLILSLDWKTGEWKGKNKGKIWPI